MTVFLGRLFSFHLTNTKRTVEAENKFLDDSPMTTTMLIE